MNLLTRKKKREVLDISSEQLCDLLKNAASLAIEEINRGSYTVGPEIMFEYHGTIHFAGIKYSKKLKRRDSFSEEFLMVYLDKQFFSSVEDLQVHAVLEGRLISDVLNGIIVYPEYRELFETTPKK